MRTAARNPEAGRGRVEQFTDRVEAAGKRRAQGGQRVELPPQLAQQGSALVGERRGQAGGRIEGLGDLEELPRLQPPAPRGPLDRRTDITSRPDPDTRSFLDEPARLVRLIQPARDDDRVVRGLERLGQSARGPERGRRRESRPDGRELEQAERTLIHRRAVDQRAEAGPETDGCPRSIRRHG